MQSGMHMGMAYSQPTPRINFIDPSQNNMPLQFDMNKGKPPMPIMGKSADDMDEDTDDEPNTGKSKIETMHSMNTGQMMSQPAGMMGGMMGQGGGMMGQGGGMMGQSGGIMAPWASMMSQPGAMMGMGDQNMMMGGGMWGNWGQMGQSDMSMMQSSQLQVITLKNAVLYPPPPNAPPPPIRERPPGCKTLFIGGVPENATEEMLQELLQHCGSINSIRMNKKNYAHIRFDEEESVDRALYLSGYRMKIEGKDDKPNTGRLHFDYAQARNDTYEFECQQRALAREERHRQRLEEDRMNPPSPPPVVHYSDHEAGLLLDKLKADSDFMTASQVLITWFERGDCNRRSSAMMYSLIQSANSHIKRLLTERTAHDQELEAMKLRFKDQLQEILHQFDQIEKVFTLAMKQKTFDHFSKVQRKNIEGWLKHCQKVKAAQQEELLKDQQETSMELSDSDDSDSLKSDKKKPVTPKSKQSAADADWFKTDRLQRDNEAMRRQIEAYKNEVELLKQEEALKSGADTDKDAQLKVMQNAMKGMQEQIMGARVQIKKDETELQELRSENLVLKLGASGAAAATNGATTSAAGNIDEAKLIALVSTYLSIHPFGATTYSLQDYLVRFKFPRLPATVLQTLLSRYPLLFTHGGDNEDLWRFVGYRHE